MKKITVIGIGKLGLCFALTLERAGYNVMGVDVNKDYVASINDKTFVSSEPGVNEALAKANTYEATTDLKKALNHSSVLYVVLPTPSLATGHYDHSYIDSLVYEIRKYGRQEDRKELIICSTVMPEYCDTLHEKMSGYNYIVSYNPEFIAQGTILRDQANPDMVLIGEGDKQAGDIIQEHYVVMTNNHPRVCRMSRVEAEITKLSLNCFLTTKIAYANMIGDIATKSGADPDIVLGAIGSDTRIGNKYLRYGYGYGGPCFPRDNRALALYAGDKGIDAVISRASDKSNNMHLLNQVKFFLDTNPEPTTITIDVVTYKPESTMIVESQQLAYAATIANCGHKVIIRERPSVIEQVKIKYGDLFEYQERES